MLTCSTLAGALVSTIIGTVFLPPSTSNYRHYVLVTLQLQEAGYIAPTYSLGNRDSKRLSATLSHTILSFCSHSTNRDICGSKIHTVESLTMVTWCNSRNSGQALDLTSLLPKGRKARKHGCLGNPLASPPSNFTVHHWHLSHKYWSQNQFLRSFQINNMKSLTTGQNHFGKESSDGILVWWERSGEEALKPEESADGLPSACRALCHQMLRL